MNTCGCLNDGDNYGCPVAPGAAVIPDWNNMQSAETRCYHILGLLNMESVGLMKPTCSGVLSRGSSVSSRHPVQPDSLQKQSGVGERGLFCLHSGCINKPALWTSVSACIMDDIAEGHARRRGWAPGRDNQPSFQSWETCEKL